MEHVVVVVNQRHDARRIMLVFPGLVERAYWPAKLIARAAQHHPITQASTTSACFGSSNPLQYSSGICLLLHSIPQSTRPRLVVHQRCAGARLPTTTEPSTVTLHCALHRLHDLTCWKHRVCR
jgi:hypothetical protein